VRIIKGHMLTIFSRQTCVPCKVVKQWLTSRNVPFIEKEAEGEEYLNYAEKHGRIVPLIIKGDDGISGLDFSRLTRLLEQ
jgi:glutaredoxin